MQSITPLGCASCPPTNSLGRKGGGTVRNVMASLYGLGARRKHMSGVGGLAGTSTGVAIVGALAATAVALTLVERFTRKRRR